MRTSLSWIRATLGVAALATLAACAKPVAQPDATPAPAETPDAAPTAPAQPAPEAPPPTEPSAAPKSAAAAGEPALASMQAATPSAKISVPVDLKYRFEGEVLENQPVTLHLAAVPRVAGQNLAVNVKAVEGIQLASAGTLNVQKASANGAYRQQFSLTRQASAPATLRVLVTMDLPEGSGFGYFSIPLTPDSVKQR